MIYLHNGKLYFCLQFQFFVDFNDLQDIPVFLLIVDCLKLYNSAVNRVVILFFSKCVETNIVPKLSQKF